MFGCDRCPARESSREGQRDSFRVVEAFLADDLESDEPIDVFLPRFKDLSHASFADSVEQNVLALDQARGIAVQKLIALEDGQPAARTSS